jgi:hypothetical protein
MMVVQVNESQTLVATWITTRQYWTMEKGENINYITHHGHNLLFFTVQHENGHFIRIPTKTVKSVA